MNLKLKLIDPASGTIMATLDGREPTEDDWDLVIDITARTGNEALTEAAETIVRTVNSGYDFEGT